VTNELNIEEQLVIVEFIEEYLRKGQFELIFPRSETVDRYKKYFKAPRSCNFLLWKWLKLGANERLNMLKDFGLRKHCSESMRQDIKSI